MGSSELSVKQVIDTLLQPGREMHNMDLVRLSALQAEDLVYFEQQWKQAGAEQRLRLIAAMVSLTEDDLTLDFTDIFRLGIRTLKKTSVSKRWMGLRWKTNIRLSGQSSRHSGMTIPSG